ncbi:MAG: hypothetical protein A3F94_02790 [Candidatus Spechtbacteria bacterium RIFCSPLOWO2_12_FULL_38_22]|uniref:EamA domain-containing protein n=1 Tax=Candidatus Spechtbacteria bacterium RIFCSPLOWO2_12_FULL_38_22 TaxID=1802165 RepID=A0A1G2HIK3_9BACT|nr:MAG: hypothetical protein A2728_03375 [Candidatus Spechtbacteria bacterium RIFCSPHIGHO2_01_FULL_38_11]OGZ60070.1 MAG: hypothetical protein A3E58_01870 [Candidatus Spechtbacteria bacterium RIFCSPHIGHO2_12_FULL_38_30]OGZ60359.1 MAG: hypothetical protein A3A00_02995 [Candidatus Spechtbacteria bacterium RIFCSPLOWO2_01_FULL_38_20]OGZ62229.1 MAG: hypothetical protein A3F94_02790 [Candidatus Spechtbacteria bacterium RIFCSPLOWO2_12_FULL_38_22]
MYWILLSLGAGLFNSATGVFKKRGGLKQLDPYTIAWSVAFFSLFILVPATIIKGIPQISASFWWALLVSGSLNALATTLQVKALLKSDMSLIGPLQATTPFFIIFSAFILLKEVPTILGLVGIIILIVGSYFLQYKRKASLFAPFKALLEDKGARLVFGAALIWGITGTVDKIGVQSSSSVFWSMFVNALMALILFPIVIGFGNNRGIKDLFSYKKLKNLVPLGLFTSLMSIFQMTALTMANVAYVVSLKRTSALTDVLFGKLFFKEPNIKSRALGATLIVIGVILISIN